LHFLAWLKKVDYIDIKFKIIIIFLLIYLFLYLFPYLITMFVKNISLNKYVELKRKLTDDNVSVVDAYKIL
jgi:hypothetical protein